MNKIAIITPFLANGGLEKVATVEAEELSKFFDVTLLVMDSYHIDYPYQGKTIHLNVSLMDRNIFKRVYNMIFSIIKLRKLKKEHNFDLVISHGELANIPNVFSGGEKNIVTVHENRFAAVKDIQGKVVNKIIKYIYSVKNVSKIVTVSEGIRNSFLDKLDMHEEQIITIYNPYNIDEIKIFSNEGLGKYNSILEHDVITTMGRLTLQKGQWYLLRIFKELKKENPDLQLIVLGDGEMKEKLINLSNDLGLKTYTIWDEKKLDNTYDVYFMGFQKNPFKIVKASKLFVMTSLWEGFGNTIVESMASGTPVISTDCLSGPGEIIAPKKKSIVHEPTYCDYGVLMPIFKNKFVYENKDLDENEFVWVETLQSLLRDDKKLQIYNNMGQKRAEDFRLEIIIKEWNNLIINCLTCCDEDSKC